LPEFALFLEIVLNILTQGVNHLTRRLFGGMLWLMEGLPLPVG
jgi:hypothetical protein